MKRLPQILFMHPGGKPSPLDWSGIPYFLTSAMEKLTRVDYRELPLSYSPQIGRYHPMQLWRRMNHFWPPIRSLHGMKEIARSMEKVHLEKFTVCFATHSTPMAYLPKRFLTAFFGDAVQDQFWNYYQLTKNFSRIDLWKDWKLEQRCLERTDSIFYSSRWACDEAMSRLSREQKSKVHVVQMGANLPEPSWNIPPFRSPIPQLLFIGNDWHRKGGDTALYVFSRLKEILPEAQMILVGQIPSDVSMPDGCSCLGSMDKSKPAHVQALMNLYQSSDFLLLPTRADCSPCVIAEAQLYGCLPLVTRVGGVPELIQEGVTGHAFELDCYEKMCFERVLVLCKNPEHFNRMRREAYQYAKTHLTWDVISRRILETLTDQFLSSFSAN